VVTEVSLDFDGDEPEGLGALTIMLGQTCSGYEMGTVVTSMIYILTDCAIQGGIPKHEFLAQAYESMSNIYDMMEGNDGRCTHN
jgi:hypothetical protein